MKRLFFIAIVSLLALAAGTSQAAAQARYGTLRYDSLLHAMPEYAVMTANYDALRQRYAQEADYNEANFKRLFTEFLAGQKDFPQNIMLKRQRDLQEEMEKSLAFRQEADSLLAAARADMEQPLRALLDRAIRAIGAERGYDCIVDLDRPGLPFLNPALTEDATPYVVARLGALRNQ